MNAQKPRWDIPAQEWVDAVPAPEPPRPTPTPEEDPACVKHEWVKSRDGDTYHCPHCHAKAQFEPHSYENDDD